MSSLTTTDVILKIFNQAQNGSTILVGGQCLMVWAIYYENQGHKGLRVATEDVDILGTKTTVRQLENLLKVRANIPTMDDMTPEVGVLHVRNTHSQSLTIDVLASVSGLNSFEVQKYAAELHFAGTTIKLLNPIGMLKSRISNVILLR